MDEAKSLVHMSISAVLTAMIIAMAVGLIGLGYTMWAYFSRQETANRRMSEYSNFTAFDNTTVRGQEVMELIESDLDVFIVIYNGGAISGKTSINEMTATGNPVALYYPDLAGIKDFDLTTIQTTPANSITTCQNALVKLKGLAGKDVESASATIPRLNGKTYNELLKIFTSSVNTSGPSLGKPGDPGVETGSYAAFKSTLVYDNDATTDVVGVVLVREHKGILNY